MEKEYIQISGTVETVIFRNTENGYTVLRLESREGGEAAVVGCLPFVVPGELLELYGEWVTHPVHGTQFRADRSRTLMPETTTDIYRFLASGAVKGIGPVSAKLIVDRFGEKSLDVIENRYEELAEIQGIGGKRALDISESYRRQTVLRRLTEFFARHEIKLRYASRLYKTYGDEAQYALEDNPYILVDEYFGASFSEADSLALKLGFDADCNERVEAAIIYELRHNAGNGHSFIPREKLVDVSAHLIGIDNKTVETALDNLKTNGRVVIEEIANRNACYLRELYDDEVYIARRIKEMQGIRYKYRGDLEKIIAETESELGIALAESQKNAVRLAAESGIMVLTGGPGTGKTTTVRTLISLFDAMGLKTAMAAPTGRAAKRMSELCRREASTIHRLLETGYDPQSGEVVFKRDGSDPLEVDAVVLDETSMVDITLMRALLCAMRSSCRLVMVGDADQLPSVGPGNLFSDIIRSPSVPIVRLTEIFRQAEESRIVKNAHKINRGIVPELGENRGDFFFLSRPEPERAARTIEELCSERLPKKLGINPSQIQVLTPTRLNETGTVRLNKRLQEALNPAAENKKEKLFGDYSFRNGDRVMQIRNNYDIMWQKKSGETGSGVFNGDIGHIYAIDELQQTITVEYDDKYVTYTNDMMIELEPAYALTVHKSQGSEYRAVVLSLCKSAPSLMSRAVLYTAVTRAKELLIVVGDADMLAHMVKNDKPHRRYSGLRVRLE